MRRYGRKNLKSRKSEYQRMREAQERRRQRRYEWDQLYTGLAQLLGRVPTIEEVVNQRMEERYGQ